MKSTKMTIANASKFACLCAVVLVSISASPLETTGNNGTDLTTHPQPSAAVAGRGPSPVSCHEVRQIFAMKQIGSAQLVPTTHINGESNELCPSTVSCCNPKMEEKYSEAVKKDLGSMLQTASSYLKTLIATSATKFRKTFTDLIAGSENQTLTLFADVYKTMEPSAKGLVSEFYSNLSSYVAGGLDFNVEERVLQFFDSLFPLVYHHVINPKLKDIGDDFKECLRETRNEIQPFGDVPQDLATNLERSLGLAKIFLQALSLGVEIINTTEHMDFGPVCGKALVKLTYCPHCRGVVSAKPCGPYCLNVIRGCLAQVAELDRPWAEFVNALERVAAGFVRTYSLEEVTIRMHTDLSNAIMNAVEMGPDLAKKVKIACGSPRRVARDVASQEKASATKPVADRPANATETTTSATETETTAPSSFKVKSARAAGEEPLLQTLQNFARKLSESKSFFGSLSDKLCSEDHLSTSSDKCWNGHEFAEYYKTIAGVGLSSLKFNPEFRLTGNGTTTSMVPLASSPVPTLVDKLRHLKQVLNDKALSVPQSDSPGHVEGSGSGSYHGNNFDNDDEDMVTGSGSGGGDDDDEGRHKATKPEDDIHFDTTKKKKTSSHKENAGGTASSIKDSCVLILVLAVVTSSLSWSRPSYHNCRL